jgi:uncharacterized protein (DUF362 family)
MSQCFSRRELLSAAGAALFTPVRWACAQTAPSAPVALARCDSYDRTILLSKMNRMFDQLGGLGRIVNGKTVAIKVNLTGTANSRLGYLPIEDTTWTHPAVIGATISLLGRAGARRIRVLESPWKSADPLEEFLIDAGWEPRDLLNAASNVEFENTNFLGRGKKYVRIPVPNGGHMFKSFDLNHSYDECDVFVSIAKLKEHLTAGVTLTIKNCFGITPCTIYGDGAPEDEPGLTAKGGRLPLHIGNRQPSRSAVPENDPNSPRQAGYRIPRIIADLVAARPVHLGIVDGIRSMTSGETARQTNTAVRPGVLIAGTNCVCTDAVGTAVMGFDPMAMRGTKPFETCDNTLVLAEQHGIGTRDLARIEVIGASLSEVRFDYRGAAKRA